MALDLMHADAVDRRRARRPGHHRRDRQILHAVLAYREHARETPRRHPAQLREARDRPPGVRQGAATCSAIELRIAPVDPKTTLADVDAMAELIDDHTIAIMGSACNYGYGTIDPIAELAELALERGVGLHVDGCLGGFILPVRPGARLRHPRRSTSGSPASPASRPTPTSTATRSRARSTLLFRDKALRNGAVLPPHRLERRQVHVAGHRGLALGRPARRAPGRRWCRSGREGYREHARADLRDRRRDEGRRPLPPGAADHGQPRRSASRFTSDEFDIYHVDDFMRPEGLAVQRPAVPQRDPHGRHPAADASRGSSRRSRPTWPRRSRTRRRSTRPARRRSPARSTAGVGGSALDQATSRTSSSPSWTTCSTSSKPCLRHERRPPGTWSSPSTSARADPRSGSSRCAARSSGGSTRPCRRTPAPAASRRRTPSTGGRWSASPYAVPRAPPTSRGSWPSASPASGPARSRSTSRVGRSGRACCGATPAGRRTRERPSADRSPATRRSRWPRGCVAAAGSRRSRATTRSATCSSSSTSSPTSSPGRAGYLEPVDYLTMRFTGVPAASHASMTGAWLTDNRSLATLAYDDVLVRATGVDASRLPPLVATGSVVGAVSPSVAEDLGLPPTAVAVTGLPDLHSAAVGAGAIGLGEPHASIGTTAWISAPVPRKKSDLLRHAGLGPGPGQRVVPPRQQPGVRRPQPAVVARRGRARARLRRPAGGGGRDASRGRRGGVHAVAHRRAVAGRRPQRPRRLPRDRRGHHAGAPDPRGAGGRRPQRHAGCSGRPRSSSGPGSTTSGSSAGERGRTSGARSWPTPATVRSSGSPTPGWPGCAERPCSRR